MEKTLKLLSQGFESSSQTTPEFASYARTFKSEIKKEISKIGGELISFNRGHFYVSGFFKVSDKIYYFSQSDVRSFGDVSLLIRTAKHEKDYTGGSNNFTTIREGLFDRLPA